MKVCPLPLALCCQLSYPSLGLNVLRLLQEDLSLYGKELNYFSTYFSVRTLASEALVSDYICADPEHT